MGIYSDVVDSLNPRAYWKLNEVASSTVVTDSSGNGLSGTAKNGVLLGEPSLIASDLSGTSASFDGSDDWIDLDDLSTELAGSPAITGACMINTTLSTAFMVFIPVGDSGATNVYEGFGFAIFADGSVRVGGRSSTGDSFQSLSTPAGIISADTNTHLVGTLDYTNNVGYIYVDGVLSTTVPLVFGNSTFTPSDVNPSAIGWTGNVNTSFFWDGTIDDLALFDKVLTDSEVVTLYNATLEVIASEDTRNIWAGDNVSPNQGQFISLGINGLTITG